MSPQRRKPHTAAEPREERSAMLTHIALVMALSLVVARAMISEVLRDPMPDPGGGAAVMAPVPPGPTTTVALNLLCCVPALLVLVRRLVDRTYVLRWSWSAGALLALSAFAMLSTIWATDRFAALVTSSTFV